MKSDRANKGEPGPDLAVADKVRMDLSPCELHDYQASVVLFPHGHEMKSWVTGAPVQLTDY